MSFPYKWKHERVVNVSCTGLGYTQVDTLTVRLCYHTYGKLIFNWWFMHPLTHIYSQHNILIVILKTVIAWRSQAYGRNDKKFQTFEGGKEGGKKDQKSILQNQLNLWKMDLNKPSPSFKCMLIVFKKVCILRNSHIFKFPLIMIRDNDIAQRLDNNTWHCNAFQ